MEENKQNIPEGEIREVEVQRLIVKFANGKTGIFSGLAVFTKAEMELMPPRIVDVTITNPEPFKAKVPAKGIIEENQNESAKG